jgi:thioredoxin reductase
MEEQDVIIIQTLSVPGEDRFMGKGIFYYAKRDDEINIG